MWFEFHEPVRLAGLGQGKGRMNDGSGAAARDRSGHTFCAPLQQQPLLINGPRAQSRAGEGEALHQDFLTTLISAARRRGRK